MTDDWDDDDFLIDDDDEIEAEASADNSWKMLIVDDEAGIHDVTKIALKRFSFEGRKLHFLSAYSAAEALEILQKEKDVALILLDVVMEHDHAGLDCARQIREDLNLFSPRIVLRTGQPGVAPEEEVILAYDINDYRAKTELTTERLFTTVVSALRSYRDILALNKYREDAYQMLGQNRTAVQSLIDISSEGLMQTGSDHIVLRVNEAFAKLVNQDKADLVGGSLNEMGLGDIVTACQQEAKGHIIQLNGASCHIDCHKTSDGYNIKLSVG